MSVFSQQVTTRLQGTDNKRKTQITKKRRSVRKLLEDFSMFDGTYLSLISDVDQDTKMFGSNEKH